MRQDPVQSRSLSTTITANTQNAILSPIHVAALPNLERSSSRLDLTLLESAALSTQDAPYTVSRVRTLLTQVLPTRPEMGTQRSLGEGPLIHFITLKVTCGQLQMRIPVCQRLVEKSHVICCLSSIRPPDPALHNFARDQTGSLHHELPVRTRSSNQRTTHELAKWQGATVQVKQQAP